MVIDDNYFKYLLQIIDKQNKILQSPQRNDDLKEHFRFIDVVLNQGKHLIKENKKQTECSNAIPLITFKDIDYSLLFLIALEDNDDIR